MYIRNTSKNLRKIKKKRRMYGVDVVCCAAILKNTVQCSSYLQLLYKGLLGWFLFIFFCWKDIVWQISRHQKAWLFLDNLIHSASKWEDEKQWVRVEGMESKDHRNLDVMQSTQVFFHRGKASLVWTPSASNLCPPPPPRRNSWLQLSQKDIIFYLLRKPASSFVKS